MFVSEWLAPVSVRENRAMLQAKRLRKWHCTPAANILKGKEEEGTWKMNVVRDMGRGRCCILPFCWGCLGGATGRAMSEMGSPQTGDKGGMEVECGGCPLGCPPAR